jgi:hypothetical protein
MPTLSLCAIQRYCFRALSDVACASSRGALKCVPLLTASSLTRAVSADR